MDVKKSELETTWAHIGIGRRLTRTTPTVTAAVAVVNW
jgi:hypothetical protein